MAGTKPGHDVRYGRGATQTIANASISTMNSGRDSRAT